MRKAKKLITISLISIILLTPTIEAKSRGGGFNPAGIIKAIMKQYGVNLDQLETNYKELEELYRQYEMFEKQLKSLDESKNALTGKNGFGWANAKSSARAWLSNEQNIKNLLNSYKSSSSQFGRLAQEHEKQFPIDAGSFMGSDYTQKDIDYYNLSAKTVLSARTASELEFNNIDTKLEAQEILQRKIDTTNDVKAAIDLLARLQAENNKIQLENLRMLSVLTQQEAVSEQARINAMAQNAKFLSRTKG